MKCCINDRNAIRLLFLSAKLLKFEIQKCGQKFCVHISPIFSCPVTFSKGHIHYAYTQCWGSYIGKVTSYVLVTCYFHPM